MIFPFHPGRRRRRGSLGRFEVDFLELLDAEHIEREPLVEGLALALAGSCAGSTSRSRPWPCAPICPDDDQLTLRGGICGWATKAMPSSPKSARQTAFQVATALGLLAGDQRGDVVGGRRHHRFDHEAGLRHADRQAASCRPAGWRRRRRRAKMFGKAGLRWYLSMAMKPRGLVRPSMPRTAGDAAEGRQHHREGEGQFVRRLDGARRRRPPRRTSCPARPWSPWRW